jgi:anthranilate phosphoribosyltransferase
VLEYFGYKFSNDHAELERSLSQANIFFMHAPLFHPAMKNVAPIRKELGVKTFFNMLGPMVNPAFPPRQLVGVFSLELARQYGYLYQNTNKEFVVLHDIQGYDEISLTGPFKVFTNEGESVLEPEDLGLTEITPEEIRGGTTVEESAKMFLNILEGNGTKAQNAVVIANAGMALFCADRKGGHEKAIGRARESLESGKALETFKRLLNK